MMTVQANDFLANTAKYINFDNFQPLTIVNEIGQRIKLSMPKVKVKEKGRMATEEELEMFRIAMEQRAQGRYDYRRDNETVEEFFERITADV